MESVHEYALFIAVTLPIGVIAAMNVLLALSGESGTLLLPRLGRYPIIPMDDRHGQVEPDSRRASVEAANEHELREAA